MRKIVLLGMFAGFIVNASAIPTMAIPNIVYPNSVSVAAGNYNNDDASNTNSKPSVNPATIAKQVRNQLPGFNADVRGAIINSGQFKVVRMPNSIWNGNTTQVQNMVKSASGAVAAKSAKSSLPDYILLGQVSSITQNEDTTPVKYTDKNTNQYNIDIAVDYKLIKTTDNSIMASFTAYGHANDVKILTAGNATQVQTHNIPFLVKTASKNLGTDVLSQLQTQFGLSSENYDNGSKVITDVKVYKD